MSNQTSEKELYKLARKRVEEKKGFYSHLVAYILVNILLVVIWAATGRGFPWFVFPLSGWGIGILFHFLGTFIFSRRSDWEQREIEKEVDKLRRGGG